MESNGRFKVSKFDLLAYLSVPGYSQDAVPEAALRVAQGGAG